MADKLHRKVANDNEGAINLRKLSPDQRSKLGYYFREARKLLAKDQDGFHADKPGLKHYLETIPEDYRRELLYYMPGGYSLLHHCIKLNAQGCAFTLIQMAEKLGPSHAPHMPSFIDLGTRKNNTRGFTPLHLLCLEQNTALFNSIISFYSHDPDASSPQSLGPNPYLQNEDGQIPLHIACRSGNLTMVQDLLDYMDQYHLHDRHAINTADRAGITPLHIAMACGYEDIAKMLIAHGADKTARCKEIHPITGKGMTPYEISWYNPEVQHMVHDFTAHVVLPSMIMKAGYKYKEGDNIQRSIWYGFDPEKVDSVMEKLEAGTEHALFVKSVPGNLDPYQNDQLFFRPLRLQRTWHHPPVNFPSHLLTLHTKDRAWVSLLPDGYRVPDSNLSIVCLDKSTDLSQETAALHHSVGTSIAYILRCVATRPERRSHILSVRDEAGNPLSTIEMKISTRRYLDGSTQSVKVPSDEKEPIYLHVMMHRGPHNEPIDKHSPSYKALQSFLKDVSEGLFLEPEQRIDLIGKSARHDTRQSSFKLNPNRDKPAETEPSREQQKRYGEIFSTIGYIPTWHAIEECFYEYRDSKRAASLGFNNGELAYDKLRVENPMGGQPYTHYLHFIDGHYEGPNKAGNPPSVDMRQMGIESWLQATGLNECIYDTLKTEFNYQYTHPKDQPSLDLIRKHEADHPDIKPSEPSARDKPRPDKVIQHERERSSLYARGEKPASFVGNSGGEVVPFKR